MPLVVLVVAPVFVLGHHPRKTLLGEEFSFLPVLDQLTQQVTSFNFSRFLSVCLLQVRLDDLGKVAVRKGVFVGELEFGGGIVFNKGARVVPLVAPLLRVLAHPFESYILLHRFHDLAAFFALEEKGPELGPYLHNLLIPHRLHIEGVDICLRNDQLQPFRKPGRLFEYQSVGRDIQSSFVLLLFSPELAVMLGQDVDLQHFGFDDTAAALFGANHVLEPLVLLLKEDLGIVDFLLPDERCKGAVEVRLGAFVQQALVATVVFEDVQDLVTAVHLVQDIDPAFLLLQKLLQVLACGFFHYRLVKALEACIKAFIVLSLAPLQLQEDLFEFVEAGTGAGLELMNFLGGPSPQDFLLFAKVFLEYDFRPPVKGVDGLFLVVKYLAHFGLTVLHVLADFFKGFLLPLNDVVAKFKDLSEVGTEVLPESLPVALDAINREGFLFYKSVVSFVGLIARKLFPKLAYKLRLDFEGFFAGFQFFEADAFTAVMEEPEVGVDLLLIGWFAKEF